MKKIILLCTSAVIFPTAAFAQSTGSQDFEQQAIIVTGSRIQDVGGVQAPDTPKSKAVLTQEIIARQNPGQTILDTIMGREQWLPGLLSRAQENKLVLTSFDPQRQTRLLKHPSNEIRKLASAVFAPSETSSRQAILETFQSALSLRGEPANGKIVFGQACAVCHQLEGVGQAIGPDLRSVTQHTPDKLLAAILDPSADIQPGFMAYFCERNNGEQLYGIVAGETGSSITMKLADGATRTILRDDIKSLQSSNVSLMPEGLEAALNPQTMADLIAYLKQPK